MRNWARDTRWSIRLAPSQDGKRLYSVLKASVPGTFCHAEGPDRRSLKSSKTAANWAGPRRWAYSSVGLEHTPDKREVGSSNLPRPTNYHDLTWGCSSAGRAAALQAVGRRFDSGQLHQFSLNRPGSPGVIASWSFDDSSAARMRKLLLGHIPSRGFLIRE